MMDNILKTTITLLLISVYGLVIYSCAPFLILLVVCTAGLGAIPLIMVISATMLFLQKLWGVSNKKLPSLSVSQKKLIVYINACEKNNINKNDIIKKLVEEGGWKIESVEEAYAIRDKLKCFDNRYIF